MPFHDHTPLSEHVKQSSMRGDRRIALVIGNSKYQHAGALKNPANDARSMDQALRSVGFDVIGGRKDGVDVEYGDLGKRIRDFGRRLKGDVDVALLYYAGHGIQVDGRNYLIPVDAALETEADVGTELIELENILREMERPNRRTKDPKRTIIVLLDACRNNPLASNLARAMGPSEERSVEIVEGLAEQKVVAGTLVAYATQPGHVAYDGEGENGYFTQALLAHLADPDLDVELMLREVRTKVVAATQGKKRGAQVPWVHSSLMGSFRFNPGAASPAVRPERGSSSSLLVLAAQEWAELRQSKNVEHLRRFAHAFRGYYGALALERIADLEVGAPSNPSQPSIPRFEVHVGAKGRSEVRRLAPGGGAEAFQDIAEAPLMVVIPPGAFLMGTTEIGAGRADEHPARTVTIGKPFALAACPVTVSQWDAARKIGLRGPTQKGPPTTPATGITWDWAQSYVKWLAGKTGKKYRLPTEAEWEYACRAGEQSAYSCGPKITAELANFDDRFAESGKAAIRVGLTRVRFYPHNKFGLYDMHGNVWEWVEDDYHPSYKGAPRDSTAWKNEKSSEFKVVRGGCFASGPSHLRSARRARCHRNQLNEPKKVGFRIARDL